VAKFIMRVHRTFGVVGGIFCAFDSGSLECLVAIFQFLYALVTRVPYRREPLLVARCPALSGPTSLIITELIRSRFIAGRTSFAFTVFAHKNLLSRFDAYSGRGMTGGIRRRPALR